MGRRAGWTDRARIIDSGATDRTASLGVIGGADHEWNRGGLEARGGVNYGSKTAYISQGINQYTGSIVLETDNLYFLRFIGEVSTTDLINTDQVEELTFQQQASDDKYAEMTGFKFGDVTVSIEVGDVIVIEASGQGTGGTIETGLLSKVDSSADPERVSAATIAIDSVAIGGLQSIEFNINRNLEARADAGSGSEDPEVIMEGLANVTIPSMIIDIEDSTAWDRVKNGSSHTLSITLSNGEVLKFLEVEFDNVDPDEQDGEGAVKSITQSGTATEWTVENIGGI